jgi:hypothetical protein
MLGILAVAGVSHAAVGTVSMTWDGCTGPVDKTTNVGGPYALFLTVIGQDEPHKAYDVRFLYGNASQEVPDAWRFDAAGCEGSTLIQQNVATKTCPGFMQSAPGLQIRKVQFSPPSDPYVTSLMQVLLANSYNAGVTTVDPNTRYLLEQVVFDLSAAVDGAGSPPATCGGFEQTMCFRLTLATWLDLNGSEHYFVLEDFNLHASFNGPSPCAFSPARATTWGSVKNQYRN